MTSTGTFQGLAGDRKSSKVLKPPGGGSSDIFGSTSETDSPRRSKQNHQQSQLSSSFFGSSNDHQAQAQAQQQQQPASNGSSAPETPRSNKPGNDSYKRLFGPPDAPPPSTPNSKYHMRSNISLSSGSSGSTCSPTSVHRPQIGNGDLADGNGYHHNDVVDGNPVTGTGYDGSVGQHNGTISGSASSAGSEKSSTDSSPSVGAAGVLRMKNRVPPGGYSSGLW